MSTNDRRSENRIAPEDTPATPGKMGEPDTLTGDGATRKALAPRHAVLGTDADGAVHHWDTDQNLLFVVADDGLELVVDLQGRDIQSWEHHVAERRGWA